MSQIKQKLIQKLNTISDSTMRCHALTRLLVEELETSESWSISDLVEALAEILTGSLHGDAACAIVIDTLALTLSKTQSLPYDLRSALYQTAKNTGHAALANSFLSQSPLAQVDDQSLPSERPIIPNGRTLTLGERKTLARSHSIGLVKQLLADPHPEVVKVLLDNPHLTESDVLVVASRRPIPTNALLAIAQHPRWRVRYSVRRALVLNPNTPTDESIRLMLRLRPQDLQKLMHDPQRPQLREHAQALVALIGQK